MQELTFNDIQAVSGGFGAGAVTGLIIGSSISALPTLGFIVFASGGYLGKGDVALFGKLIFYPPIISTAIGMMVDLIAGN